MVESVTVVNSCQLSREQRKTKQTLHPAPCTYLLLTPGRLKARNQWRSVWSLHDAELRVPSPRASFTCHSTSSVLLWRKPSRRHVISSKQQRSQPKIFAVTVIVVAFGRLLYNKYFISQPPRRLSAQLLILLTSHRIILASSPVWHWV